MTLQQRLDAHKATSRSKMSPQAVDALSRATRDLVDSGIVANAAAAGDRLPPFELPSYRGDLVRSPDLLAQGPLVLTIYRGVW